MASTGGTNLRDDIMRLDETGTFHAFNINNNTKYELKKLCAITCALLLYL